MKAFKKYMKTILFVLISNAFIGNFTISAQPLQQQQYPPPPNMAGYGAPGQGNVAYPPPANPYGYGAPNPPAYGAPNPPAYGAPPPAY